MARQSSQSLVVMKSTLSRLPLYYSYIRKMQGSGMKYVSSSVIAQGLNINPVLVRKDLAGVSSEAGKPRAGFGVDTLLIDLGRYLGYDNIDKAIVVGIGSLGRLVLTSKEFETLGMHVVVGFDRNPDLIGTQMGDKYVLPMEKMDSFVKRTGVKIGIITVPADQAQDVCDQMVKCGIQAIWNFAFTLLNMPADVIVKNENLPASLALLSHQLENKINFSK